MTEPTSESIALHVDQLCDRFKAAWRSGQRPRIEDLLASTTATERSDLLRALLLVELELVAASGQTPSPSDYHRRFSGDLTDVEWAFAAAALKRRSSRAADVLAVTHTLQAVGVDTSKIGEGVTAKLPAEPPTATIGRFQILEVLGEGAFGIVCKAHDPQLDRTVAIKVPRQGSLQDEADRRRFLREAQSAAKLSHPNICRVFEVGEQAGCDYIVMELVTGKPLSAYLAQGRAQTRQAAMVVRKLALALAEAHATGIVHRDLKPANIMINRHGEPIIMDFGLARLNMPGDAQLTVSGAIMGSPAYMSPEQARGATDNIGPATDVYSLGVVLYEMLCGQRPFQGTLTEVLAQILQVEPPALARHRPDVDPTLAAICLKAMAKQPGERYGSMKEFAQALAAYLKTTSASSRTGPVSAATAESSATLDRSNASVALPSVVPVATNLTPRPAKAGRSRPAVALLASGFAAAALVFAGILLYFRTPTATVLVEVDVDLQDKSLGFLLDGDEVSSEKLAAPVQLAVGPHELLIVRDQEEFRWYRFLVHGSPEPGIQVTEMRPRPASQAGLVSLFNGRDLTGWTTPTSIADRWRVEDGALVGTKTKAKSLLAASMAPAGVLFRTEYQLGDGGAGGVAIGLPGDRHVLVEVRTPPSGAGGALLMATGLLSFPGTGWDPDRSYDWWCQYPPRQKPASEWNQLEISVAGGVLVVTVNGREVNRRVVESIPPLRAAVQSKEPLTAMLLPDVESRLKFRGMAFKPLAAPPPPPNYFQPSPGTWTPILTTADDFTRATKRGDVRLTNGIIDVRSGSYETVEDWTGPTNALGIEAPVVGRNVVLRAKVKKLAGTEAHLWTRHLTRSGAGVVMFRDREGPRLAIWGGSDSRTRAAVPAKSDAEGFIDVAIAVIDNRAILFVDGAKVDEGKEDQFPATNIIAFRVDDDPGKEVHFQVKELRICVLDGTDLTPEQAMDLDHAARSARE